MVLLIAAVMACVYCLLTKGIQTIGKIPVSDELPAFPTREPISVATPILIDASTGVPIYPYTNAMATRDT
jgi:hypothetical protein